MTPRPMAQPVQRHDANQTETHTLDVQDLNSNRTRLDPYSSKSPPTQLAKGLRPGGWIAKSLRHRLRGLPTRSRRSGGGDARAFARRDKMTHTSCGSARNKASSGIGYATPLESQTSLWAPCDAWNDAAHRFGWSNCQTCGISILMVDERLFCLLHPPKRPARGHI